MYMVDGSRYEGAWINGLKEGEGKLYYPDDRLKYVGKWKNDQYEGYGELFDDATPQGVQKGTWKNGELSVNLLRRNSSFLELARSVDPERKEKGGPS